MKKIILLSFITCPFFLCKGQVGINTNNPKAMLDVVSAGNSSLDNIVLIENADKIPILTIKNDGRIGLGMNDPITRLDLRDDKDNSIIAIGESSLTPSVAKSGTIRYNPNQKLLNYSDGSNWVKISANKIKAKVNAVLPSLTLPNSTSVIVNNWSEILDNTNSFNATTGIFTAQSDGIYTISFEMILKDASVTTSSYASVDIVSSGGQSIKSLSAKESNGTYYVDLFCAGSFDMLAGQTLRIIVWHNFGSSRSAAPEFNNLTIIEN